jgi:hypothetical protein
MTRALSTIVPSLAVESRLRLAVLASVRLLLISFVVVRGAAAASV